ncbi:uncharacterized protein [Miscanthus floridulus]|uniref:uncharacterized protein n=1 Tax=Miscanthus floridulus TaxID=154761 RepID=UPI003457A0A8
MLLNSMDHSLFVIKEITKVISSRLLRITWVTSSTKKKTLRKMACTKLTARKRTIMMPTRRMRFTLGKCVPPHLVEALRNMVEEPQEEQPVEVPIKEPLEEKLEDEPMDEETEEGPMFEELMEIEESDEEPMEEDEQGVRMELVILKKVMLLTTLILMMGVMMVVMMEMMVMIVEIMVMMVTVMEEMVEMTVMTTMPHCWLRGGPWRSTMICRVMPTTTQSFSPLYAATTPDAPCSTGQSIGPTPTTPASGRRRCTSTKGVGCATSTMLSQHGSHV